MRTSVINGPFIGKVGNVVGAKSRGIHYKRSVARSGSVAPSKKQLKQRQVFAIVSIWLNPLKAFINSINVDFKRVYIAALKEVGCELLIYYPKAVFRKAELLI